VEAVQKELLDRDEAIKQLKAHLLRAQERMKHFADKKRYVTRVLLLGSGCLLSYGPKDKRQWFPVLAQS
jgi:hypothetical protein